jgi:hypothetical protein
VNIDFETEPIGVGKGGKAVFLRDVWPSHEEVTEVYIVDSLSLFILMLCKHYWKWKILGSFLTC